MDPANNPDPVATSLAAILLQLQQMDNKIEAFQKENINTGNKMAQELEAMRTDISIVAEGRKADSTKLENVNKDLKKVKENLDKLQKRG